MKNETGSQNATSAMMAGGTRLAREIGCYGNRFDQPGSPQYKAMEEVGRLLAQRGYKVKVGGCGGAFEAVAKGVRSVPSGEAIGYVTTLTSGRNPYLTSEISCYGQNCGISSSIELQDGIKNAGVLSAGGFIFSAGGGPEEMAALMTAITGNTKGWWPHRKRIAILKVSGGIKGWDLQTFFSLCELKLLPKIAQAFLGFCNSPKAAVDWVDYVTP